MTRNRSMHLKSVQNFLYMLILIGVAAFFWYTLPEIPNESHGILLPYKIPEHGMTSVNEVKVLGHYPKHFEKLGLIRTTRHFDSSDLVQQDNDEVSNIAFARQLAAEVGANGIVITMMGHTAEKGPLDGILLNAEAIQEQDTQTSSKDMPADQTNTQ